MSIHVNQQKYKAFTMMKVNQILKKKNFQIVKIIESIMK